MIEQYDPASGEIYDGDPMELVALDMAGLDEDAMLALFPTPVQAAGALLMAREAVRRAPTALRGARNALRTAERSHRVTLGKVTQELARDWDMALGRDVKLLISINANFRTEHRA
ncbi:hypothetical protein C5E10_06235 [Pseudoclavibacter sp. RFBG4]|uniref:hypothetical protein n=1 Tax=Pseudoclavibacter sp. RFBG4 TaxID=2080575 RepID=UPI000CE9325C|nr:hypothetical protein [Pseudoclavibacter sp. RFBG4]PPG35186.1 hypothetical protein C5E10_06235 [Pseudoclavibacter sp. RFBG4]